MVLGEPNKALRELIIRDLLGKVSTGWKWWKRSIGLSFASTFRSGFPKFWRLEVEPKRSIGLGLLPGFDRPLGT